jgi:hypothetical protein
MGGRIRVRGSAEYAGQDWLPAACIIWFLPDLFRNSLPLIYHAIAAISTKLGDPDFMRGEFSAANASRYDDPKLRKDGCYRQPHTDVRLDTMGFLLGIIQYLNIRADGTMYCAIPDGDEFFRGLGMGRISTETTLSEHCVYVGRVMAERMGWIEYRPVKELKDGKWKGLPGIIIFAKKFFKDFGLLKALDNPTFSTHHPI